MSVQKRLGGSRNSIDVEKRTATFICSTEAPDRYGDRVKQNWKLDRYLGNPQFLYAHQQRELPIGRALDVGVRAGKLVGTFQFASADENPFAETCWRMVQAGHLSAVSVGFIPHKVESYTENDKRGYVLDDNELLEVSLVPIPANADCLVRALDAGIDIAPMVNACRSLVTDLRGDAEMALSLARSLEVGTVDSMLAALASGVPRTNEVQNSSAAAESVYDADGAYIGVRIGGSVKVSRSYQDVLAARNLAAIQQQASTIEEKGGVSVNFFLRRAVARARARAAQQR